MYKVIVSRAKGGREIGIDRRERKKILAFAEYHIPGPMPNITPRARPSPRRGGWWRPMGAISHWAKSNAKTLP